MYGSEPPPQKFAQGPLPWTYRTRACSVCVWLPKWRGNVDAVIAAAQRMYEFVKGAEPAAPAEAVTTPPEPVAVAEPKAELASAPVAASAEEAAAPEPLVTDPIAACGTALVMPEGGNLAKLCQAPRLWPLLRFRSKRQLRRPRSRLPLRKPSLWLRWPPPRSRPRKPRSRLSLRKPTVAEMAPSEVGPWRPQPRLCSGSRTCG